MRGRFLEAILSETERKLAGPGRPGTVDGLVVGGAPGGAAPSLGRARCLAARGGYVNPASGGATSLHPGASRRSIPSRGSRGTGKPRTHCAARMRKLGCLKFEFDDLHASFPGRDAARSAASQNRDRTKHPRSVRPRLCSASLRAALRSGHAPYTRSNNCRISVVIRPSGDTNSSMMEKWFAPGISS
jgi:hypothetical protein